MKRSTRKGSLRKSYKKKTRKFLKYSKKSRGGGSIVDACQGPKGNSQPPPEKNHNPPMKAETLETLKNTIIEKTKDTKPDLFILKVGSNDSGGVQTGKYAHIKNSAGANPTEQAIHYIETGDSARGTGTPTTVTIDTKNKDFASSVAQYLSKLVRFKNITLVAISPIPGDDYETYTYPFIQHKSEYTPYSFYSSIANGITNKAYIQSEFPLNANPGNREFLDYFVQKEEPLLIFNAIASTCYTSLKYIIDLRMLAGKRTFYMGLCDTQPEGCHLASPIYPDREKSCEKYSTNAKPATKTNTKATTTNTKATTTNTKATTTNTKATTTSSNSA